jgi:hypothetical protein
MNFNFFDESKPAYIAVNTDGFRLGGNYFKHLNASSGR